MCLHATALKELRCRATLRKIQDGKAWAISGDKGAVVQRAASVWMQEVAAHHDE